MINPWSWDERIVTGESPHKRSYRDDYCQMCEGKGEVIEEVAQAGNQVLTGNIHTCPNCSGSGRQ